MSTEPMIPASISPHNIFIPSPATPMSIYFKIKEGEADYRGHRTQMHSPPYVV